MFKLAPSILSANFAKLKDEIDIVQVAGVSVIHIDVMDGHFVPNITIGPPVIKDIKAVSKLPLDVHLMIEKPENHIDSFVKAGSDILQIHIEATNHPERHLRYIKSLGVKSGIAFNPATPIDPLHYLIGSFDQVTIMTVNPGFGGQTLIPATLEKIKKVKQLRDQYKLDFIIEVDGGVTEDKIKFYVDAGADLVVAGNAIYGAQYPVDAINNLLRKGNG